MKLLATIFGATLLTLTATAQPVLTTLCHFNGTNGANPLGRLVLGKDGSLYGTTVNGGTNGDGIVFKVSTGGIVTTLAALNGTTGANPDAGLTQGTNGILYGTANAGGANTFGTAFQVTTNGTLTLLASFGGTNGTYPEADWQFGNDGSLYSTTSHGTAGNGYGTICKLTAGGTLFTLTSFTNGNGAFPNALLAGGTDGAFYGVTPYGGRTNLNSGNGYGTIFKVATNGVLTPLFYFGGTNGNYPNAGLALGGDGCFYGTTEFGGSNNLGMVFKTTTNGVVTPLASFNGNNGEYPIGTLIPSGDGGFYGTTFLGGTNDGSGTVYKITTNGVLTSLISFSTSNGAYPKAGLALGSDGNIYGTTYYGGNFDDGTVFKITLPSVPVLRNLSVSNHTFKATVTGAAAATIQIQYATNLPPAWSVLTNLVFTTGTNQFTDPATSSRRFYRAVSQ